MESSHETVIWDDSYPELLRNVRISISKRDHEFWMYSTRENKILNLNEFLEYCEEKKIKYEFLPTKKTSFKHGPKTNDPILICKFFEITTDFNLLVDNPSKRIIALVTGTKLMTYNRQVFVNERQFDFDYPVREDFISKQRVWTLVTCDDLFIELNPTLFKEII